METRMGPAGRYIDPVFQHSWRHYVGFVRDLVKAVPSGLSQMLSGKLLSFSLPRRLVLGGSLFMRVQATDIF